MRSKGFLTDRRLFRGKARHSQAGKLTGEARSEVKVMGVYAHQDQGTIANHFVLLRDERKRRIPIFVGQCEAWAISLALEGERPNRPYTHDAMLDLLALTSGVLEEVCINDLREETFYSIAQVRVGDAVKEMELRPSDGIALALRARCSIYMGIGCLRRR